MKNLRLIALTTTSFVSAAGMVLFACSSDDTIVTADGGTDGSLDGPASGDSQADGPATDGGPDVITDAGLTFQNMPGKISESTCRALARCCYGNANLEAGAPVDGGTFDKDTCVTDGLRFFFENSNANTNVADAASVSIDQAAGVDCLNRLEALACNLNAADYQAARKSCFDAYKGNIANGSNCTASLECGQTSFCQPDNDGGPSKCAPLRTNGQPCGDYPNANPTNADKASEFCNHRASGEPKFYCDNFDFTLGDFKADPADWKCAPVVANGGRCTYGDWCANGLCNAENGALACVPQLEFFKLSCSVYVK